MDDAARPSETSNYQAICKIASGGMGRVDLAIREEGAFRRLYAVKRLKAGFRDDEDFLKMFFDEARIAGFLRHPHVVSVLDVGTDVEGPFLVMDYVEGVSLATLIRHAEGTTLPLQICLEIVRQCAEGLHAAHELIDPEGHPLGLVHRDVSPQNVLVGYDGVVRVTDFGVAKAVGRMTRTTTGVLKGKYGYMSPELLQFEEPDRRSDLFSLGVLLFELLTGERLYPNRTGMDGVRRILREPPPDMGEYRDDATPELVQLVFSLLAKDRTHRPADARQVARRAEAILAELVAEEGRLEIADFLQEAFAELRSRERERVAEAMAGARRAPAIAPVSTLPSPAGRGRWRWALVGAALAMLVAGGIGWRAWSSDVVDAAAGTDAPLPPSMAASSRAGSSPRSESVVTATGLPSERAGPSEAQEGRVSDGRISDDGTAGGSRSARANPVEVGASAGDAEAAPDSDARRRARRRAERPERPERAAMNSLPMWGWQ